MQTLTTTPTPSLTSISPSSSVAGSAATNITATGSNFVSTSVVMWNGTALSTSYTSSTTLTAQLSTQDLQSAGTATITVSNSGSGGGTSGSLMFTIGTLLPLGYTTLASFDRTDGEYPYAALVQASDGNFYGTTALGHQ